MRVEFLIKVANKMMQSLYSHNKASAYCICYNDSHVFARRSERLREDKNGTINKKIKRKISMQRICQACSVPLNPQAIWPMAYSYTCINVYTSEGLSTSTKCSQKQNLVRLEIPP